MTPLEDRVGSPAGSIPDGVKVCRGGLGKAAAEYSRTIAEWILAASLELTFKLRATDETMRACVPPFFSAWSFWHALVCEALPPKNVTPTVFHLTVDIITCGIHIAVDIFKR